MFGVRNSTAIVNPPQACFLAVGKSDKSVVFDEKTKAYKYLDSFKI